jgi:hypothetical protein
MSAEARSIATPASWSLEAYQIATAQADRAARRIIAPSSSPVLCALLTAFVVLRRVSKRPQKKSRGALRAVVVAQVGRYSNSKQLSAGAYILLQLGDGASSGRTGMSRAVPSASAGPSELLPPTSLVV